MIYHDCPLDWAADFAALSCTVCDAWIAAHIVLGVTCVCGEWYAEAAEAAACPCQRYYAGIA
jgi:hypothetical protein